MKVKNNTLETDELDTDVVDEDIYEDDEDFEDEDLDEFDSDDEEVEEVEEDEDDEDVEDVEEDSDEDTADEGADNTSEALSQTSPDREFEARLLKELGYGGTYEEARAAFEAEHANEATDTPSTESDYEAMARSMLNEINQAYGLDLKDFSSFENLKEFSELAVDSKFGAVKAFAATNTKLITEGAQKAAIKKLSKPTRNVPSIPKSEAASGSYKNAPISRSEFRQYREMYPHMKDKEIIRLIRRVKKS